MLVMQILFMFFIFMISLLVGVPMGLEYLPPEQKAILATQAIACILIFSLGIMLRKFWYGKSMTLFSFFAWGFLSFSNFVTFAIC